MKCPKLHCRAITLAKVLLLLVAPITSHAFLLRDEANSIDVGGGGGLAINPNGTVLEWDFSSDGYGPRRVQGLSSIVAVSTAGIKMALRADGSVWTWGYGGYLGRGLSPYEHPTLEYGATPTKVPGLENIVAISAGPSHALALKNDGTVWAWGANYSGEVGNGTYNYPRFWTPEEIALLRDEKVPYQMPITGVVGIAAGQSFSLLLKSDGTVWGCGENSVGLIVHPANAADPALFYTTVVQVPGINNVSRIAAGESHAIALKNDSSVWTWGDNWDGQIGDGGAHYMVINTPEIGLFAIGRQVPPQAVPGLSGVTKISAGYSHSMIQKADGSIWAWGSAAGWMTYYSADLQQNVFAGRNTPVQVGEASQALALAGSPGESNAYASFPSPGPRADIRKLEQDELLPGLPPPSTPPRLRQGSISIAPGLYETDKLFRMQLFTGPYLYALDELGTVSAWGSSYTATPSPLSSPAGIVSLNSGTSSYVAPYSNYSSLSIGLRANGELVKWRPYLSASMPAIPETTITGGSDFVAIAGGGMGASYALKRDGTVWALSGTGPTPTQQGTVNSNSNSNYSFVDTRSLSNVVQIAAGSGFCLGLKKDGTVWGWGTNIGGAIRSSPTSIIFASVPLQILGLTNVKSIYAGRDMAYAIKADGSVWAWGTGYPGNGQSINPWSNPTPIQIPQLQGVVSIVFDKTLSNNTTYAIDGNGRVYSWGGSNNYGTLGLGPVSSATTPTLISGLENVVEAYMSNIVGLFRLENGLIYSCGSNQGVGLLGVGSLNGPQSNVPVVTNF